MPKIVEKLAEKMENAMLVKNVLDIMINEWSIEASVLTRSRVAKQQENAVRATNVVAVALIAKVLVVKKSTTMNSPNYHAFLTWDVRISAWGIFAVLPSNPVAQNTVVTLIPIHHPPPDLLRLLAQWVS